MELAQPTEEPLAEPVDPAVAVGVSFLTTLFSSDDTILFRPIETWVEDGKKRSRVDYKKTCYRKAEPRVLERSLSWLHRRSERDQLNLFFGVCPRIGDKGRFDLAWQIRTVRALWTDIDHVTVEEAQKRIEASPLPPPSILVNSGNGVHVYWLLDEPYLIDDAGDPPPVETEWTELPGGRKKPRKYMVEDGERVYLDQHRHASRQSAKAEQLQDVLAGIAQAVDGDHTTDLSRLLRIPGTFNRKDQRNGRPPTACALVTCEIDRKYDLSLFERFAESSPQRVERQKIEAVSLPQAKPLTPTKRDKLSELVTACAVAPAGTRSEADWRLVCTAIEKGWPKHEVGEAVAQVGKFAEAGPTYFERTWSKAESATREQIFRRAAAAAGTPNANSEAASDAGEVVDGQDQDQGLVATLASLIAEKDQFARDEGGKLYRYRGGAYRAKGEEFIKAQVKRLCFEIDRVDEWSSHVAKEVVEFIRVDSPLLWERPPRDEINVKNGILNVVTRELREHSPDYLSTIQLPAAYDPSAKCPNIDRFVMQTFPEDSINLAYEIPAWLMTPDTSIQKAVLLIGPGGNGKSRYLRMVEAFIGNICVSSLSLHRLESDKFACARLFGKLANICPDLPTEHLAGTSIFKAITGGDTVTGEYKFRDSFDFVPFARLVFSANSPPRAHDASEGFFDRWLVVPFERRFRGEGGEIPAEKLDAMLSEPSEQSGLLNRALDVLGQLRSNGRFSSSDSIERAFSEFHAATDPLAVWLDRYTLDGPTLVTPKRTLITAFNEYCEGKGRSPMSEKAFGIALKKLRQDVTDKQRTIGGKVQWCYLGVGLRSDRGHDVSETTNYPDLLDPQGSSRG